MKKYNINENVLGFDRVLPTEETIPCLVERDGKYYLQVKAPEAKSIMFKYEETEHPCLKDENGIWSTEYTLTTGMNYVHLYIDNELVLTPMLPISYGYSRPCNYVALEEITDFYALKDVPHGSLRKEYYFSKVTGEWESCMVYTPADYDKTNKEYPVLYLQHGHGENEIGWSASGKVNFILDNLIAEKRATEFVVVMSNGMVQTINDRGERIVDFMLFEKQLLEDIIPFIESKFRVGKSKEKRAMAGLSMGSLQTSITGFHHPEMFCALGIFSGFVSDIISGSPLDQVDRGLGDNNHLAILDDAEAFNKTFDVYFRAMGDKDPFWENFESDDNLLKEKKINQIKKIYYGTHDWNVWRMCIYDFAQLIFK